VVTAADGEEALRVARERRPALAVLECDDRSTGVRHLVFLVEKVIVQVLHVLTAVSA
jgi:hypothetical protein